MIPCNIYIYFFNTNIYLFFFEKYTNINFITLFVSLFVCVTHVLCVTREDALDDTFSFKTKKTQILGLGRALSRRLFFTPFYPLPLRLFLIRDNFFFLFSFFFFPIKILILIQLQFTSTTSKLCH